MSDNAEQPPDPILEALQVEVDAIEVFPAYADDDPRAADYATVEQYQELHNRCNDAERRLADGVEMYRRKCLTDINHRRSAIDWQWGMQVKDAVDRLKGKAQSMKTTKGQIGWRARGKDTVEYTTANKSAIIAMCEAGHPDLLTTTTPAPKVGISKERMAEYMRSDPLSDLHGLATLQKKGERTFYHKPPKESDDGGEV